jgi:hypothetical protein
MHRYSAYLGVSTCRQVLAVAAATASVVGLAACAGGGTQPAPTSRDPAQAIVSAVQHTEAVTSVTAKISERSNAASAGTTAVIQERVKPTLLLSMRLDQPLTPVITTVIMTPTTYYVTVPYQDLGPGKKWGKIAVRPFDSLSAMAQLFLGQTQDPLAQIMLLRTVDGVRNAGTQVISGVQTEHYIGYFVPSKAVAALPAALRDQLTPVPASMKGTVDVNIWIGPAQQIRKLSEVQTVGTASVTTTIVFSDFNQPVHITVPPASQVASMPTSG